MDERNQFTFYRSFWEAVKGLPKKDRLPILESIIEYALDGKSPSGLSKSQSAFFLLVKPNLDASRKKAASGKQGGSKPKAKGKQTESKKENEVEIEEEEENEIEKESLLCGGDGDPARAKEASANDLLGIGLKPGEFLGVTVSLVEEVRSTTDELFRKYQPAIMPQPWDYRQVFKYCGAVGRAHLLDYAFEQAAIAGKPGDWRYIDGIMNRLLAREISTESKARQWDEDRPDLGCEV